jgi:ATP-binding cassette subfamily B protein
MLQFDKIIVIEDHRIVQSGTHEELLAQEGYYAEIWEKQRQQESGVNVG